MITTLNTNDNIAIIAPAYGTSEEICQKASNKMKSIGLNPIIPENLLASNHKLCANTKEYRIKHLLSALQDPSIKAIWPLQGGYGSTQLIPSLLTAPRPEKPKLLIGFSDITALHIVLNQLWNWPTLHAPVLSQIITGKISTESKTKTIDTILGKHLPTYNNLTPINQAAQNQKSHIQAPIKGGNLSIIQTSLGTSWQLDTENSILFLEEVDEKAYNIDRILHHLQQASILQKPQAILIGDFTEKNSTSPTNEDIISDFMDTLNIPAFRLPNVGHENINLPLILGQTATLTPGKNTTLNYKKN